jgi:hypothetical protein
MAKLKHVQREELKNCVRESIIRRLTTKEIQRYIKQELDIDLSYDYLLHLRADIKKESEIQMSIYQKDRYAFLDEVFFDRTKELKSMQKSLHEIIDNEEDNEIRIKAINQLQSITTQLSNYYVQLPQIAGVSSNNTTSADTAVSNNSINYRPYSSPTTISSTTAPNVIIREDKEGKSRPWLSTVGFIDEFVKWCSEKNGSKHPNDCNCAKDLAGRNIWCPTCQWYFPNNEQHECDQYTV